MFGRRVLRAERPEAVLAGLRAIVHDGRPVDADTAGR
jgi:DhnA family fructose-bisphosphate aldolase class Ia